MTLAVSGLVEVCSQQVQLQLDGKGVELYMFSEMFAFESHGVAGEGDAVDAPHANIACKVQRASTLILVQGKYVWVRGVTDGAYFIAL